MARQIVGTLVVLALLAAPAAAADVDLYIKKFKVTHQVKLGKDKPVHVELTVENQGETARTCEIAITGTQNGAWVYAMVEYVSDPPGNGATTFALPALFATEAGDIEWWVRVDDDDPDVDEAVALTQVVP